MPDRRSPHREGPVSRRPEPPRSFPTDVAPARPEHLPLWPLLAAMLVLTVAAAALTLGLSRSGAAVLQGARGPTQEDSLNWAGYVAIGATFTSVTATWSVPAVSTSSAPDGLASFWVGMNGRGNHRLEQIGTASGYINGERSYRVWWEILPQAAVYTDTPLKPGDLVTAAVSTDGAGKYVLSLRNISNGAQFSTTQMDWGRVSSAEVVAEAPTGSHGLLPLADFGQMTFRDIAVNSKRIDAYAWSRVVMKPVGPADVETSPLDDGGTSFTVTYREQP